MEDKSGGLEIKVNGVRIEYTKYGRLHNTLKTSHPDSYRTRLHREIQRDLLMDEARRNYKPLDLTYIGDCIGDRVMWEEELNLLYKVSTQCGPYKLRDHYRITSDMIDGRNRGNIEALVRDYDIRAEDIRVVCIPAYAPTTRDYIIFMKREGQIPSMCRRLCKRDPVYDHA